MFFTIVSAVIVAHLIVCWLHYPSHIFKRDKTDPPGNRSGLAIYTDHETRVHYVGTSFGGLTPRIDDHGMPMLADEEGDQ